MGSLPRVGHMGDETDLSQAPGAEGTVSTPRGADNSNELWEWLRLLNRRKALIVGAGLISVAVMALIIAQQTPLYKASSRIMLDTRTFKVVSTEAALLGVRLHDFLDGAAIFFLQAQGHLVRVAGGEDERGTIDGEDKGIFLSAIILL